MSGLCKIFCSALVSVGPNLRVASRCLKTVHSYMRIVLIFSVMWFSRM
jgi:hypothetical protein